MVKENLLLRNSVFPKGLYTENLNNMIYKKLIILLLVFNNLSCGIYSFNGASINEDVKTIKVNYISNKSSLAQPQLSSLMTEQLIDKFQSETNLVLTDFDAHVIFSGSIVKYDIKPVSIQNNEIAAQNRLTISVEIEHINTIDEKLSFKKIFNDYIDFDSNEILSEVEEDLNIEIVNNLIEDIFNEAFMNW